MVCAPKCRKRRMYHRPTGGVIDTLGRRLQTLSVYPSVVGDLGLLVPSPGAASALRTSRVM